MALTIILTILGLAFGAALDDEFGLVVLGLVGFLLGLTANLRSRLGRLEKDKTSLLLRIEALEKGAAVVLPGVPAAVRLEPTASFSEEFQGRDVVEKSAALDGAPPVGPTETVEPDFAFEQAGPPVLPLQVEPSAFSELASKFKFFFTTANTVVAIGGVVLFFGVGFLLKYAVEHGLFPLELRYIGAGLLGLALLAAGWLLRIKRRNYALLLQGCAVGVLYIAIFSAAKWHGLIPLPLSFALLTALAVLSGMLAVLQDARGLAAFGTLGGFLAPPLTSTGGGHHVLLFSYYALLGFGILGVAYYKTWRELNLIGFFFTLGIGSAWGFEYYRPELFKSTEPFLIIFFFQYLAAAVLGALRRPADLKKLLDGTLVFGLPVAAFSLQAEMVLGMEYGLAWSALALGAIYLLLATTLWKYNPVFLGILAEAFLALGTVFGSLAIPFALDGKWTSAAWCLEGAALVWIGLRQRRVLARFFGYLLQLSSGLAFLLALGLDGESPPLLNRDFLGLMLISLGGLFTSFILWKSETPSPRNEKRLHWFFLAWGLIWWYAAGLREIDIFLPSRFQENASIAFFALSAGLMHLFYRRLNWAAPRGPIFGLAPALILFFIFHAAMHLGRHPFERYGYLAWPFALAMHYYLLYRSEDDLNPVFRRVQHVAGLALLAGLAAWELSWMADKFTGGAGVWGFLAWGLIPGFLARFLLSGKGGSIWPLKKQAADYYRHGAPLLLAWTWLWLLYGALTLAGDPWPLKYIVFLNPLEVAQLLMLVVLWDWRQTMKTAAPAFPVEIPGKFLNYFLGLTLFATAHGILARAVHFWVGIPFELRDLTRNMTFQAGLSIFWTITALGVMFAATRKNVREAWFAGAALLALVVIKLFLVDLSKTGAIARIVSFLVVGLLMLLIGYLSPLPPAPKKELAA
ncbi:MAG: DUF2339 domain-containing protein [Pseudomonadota bacterium]